MREFLRKSSLLLILFSFLWCGSRAQVTCSIDLPDSVDCAPFAILATATESSAFPVLERIWTLTGPIPNGFFKTPLGVNQNFSYIANIPGNYCLKLWSRNTNGEMDSVTICNIIVASNPTVNFTFTPTEGCLPLNILAYCNSTPGSGVIDEVAIDWGCGGNPYFNTVCPTSPIPKTYIGCQVGCHSPTVVIRNSFGCYADSTYDDIICIIPKPVANFTADTTTKNCATGPQVVNFTADSLGPNITYTWYINNVAVANPNGNSRFLTYTFPINANCYDISLKVQHPSSAGCSDSMSRVDYICIRPQPVISFTQNVTTACVKPGSPATLTFTNTSAGTPTMTWSLSGGTPPQTFTPQTGNNPSFSITNTGTYTVTVTGSFGGVCTTTVTQQALVANAKPTAFFTQSDSISCLLPLQVAYTPGPCPSCTYLWTFQGIGNSTSPSPAPTYTTYNPNGSNSSLTVTAPNGCTDSYVKQNAVKTVRVTPRMSISKAMGCAPVCVTFDNTTPLNIPGDSIVSMCWSFPGSLVPGACQDTIKRCFTSVGKYNVKLVVTTAEGCTDSLQYIDTIKVGNAPICTVTASPLSMCFEQDSVCFSLSCDSFDFARVEYGDGIIEVVTSSYFCHMYQDTGVFHPSIIAYNDSCKGDTLKSLTITILPPIAKFIDSVSCGGGSTVYLRNQSIGASSFKWYFCNGDSSTAVNPAVNLPPCDTCLVTLMAFNATNGCTHEKQLQVIPPCTAPDMTPKDTVGCVPFLVNFKNLSLNNDESYTRFRVCGSPPAPACSFGNTPCVKAGDSIVHLYNAPGVYNICMRTRTGNCDDLVTTTVRVCDINANFSPTSACYPLPVNFQDLSTDQYCGGAVSWSWRFGDSTVSTLKNPTHTFTSPGNYVVSLVVTNATGCRDSIAKTVSVAPVNVNYIIDSIICPGKMGCVVNTSTGAGLTYSLNIPGALQPQPLTTLNPCYSFATPGDYPAYLHISSAGQCDFYDTVIIHNQAPYAAGIISNTYISCPNPPSFIQFYDTSLYADSTTLWNFGDSSSTTLDTSTHIYALPGIYPVTLTVTTKDGCVSSRVLDTVVVDGPYGDFGFSPPGMCACKDTLTFTVNTVNSSSLTLVYGCNTGFSQINPITPIGTVSNPTTLSFQVPYCLTDSCQPQLIFGDTAGCQVYIDGNYAYVDSPVVNMGFDNYGVCIQGTVCFQDLTTYTLPPFRSFTVDRYWDFGDGTWDSTGTLNPCHYYDTVGGYNVKLYIRSNFGCYDSIVSQVVIVPEFPIAGFYPDDTLVCAESPLCFHDTSWIYPLTVADYWVVDFGDNNIDTFQTPDFCHAYTSGGYYRVTMCVYDSIGCPDCDSSVVIRVIDNPIADAGPDRNICYGIVTQLNGTGGTVPQWEPAGLFSDPNIYNPTIQVFTDTTIVFYVGDQYGCRDTDYVALSVANVFADFNVGTSFCEKVPVCVTDASTSINGTLANWSYDFGDSITQLGPDTCHAYNTFGTLPITLIATDTNGCKDTVTKTVTILPSPDAAFSLNDTVICSDQALCVTDLTTSNSTIASWQWNYGTVYSSTSQSPPCYTFQPPYSATYDISLIVVDQSTCRDTALLTVTVNQVPTANFAAPVGCETDLIQFSSTSSGSAPIIGCEWLFWVGSPNPTIANTCNAQHQFPAGNYPVQLVVTDVNGCTDTIVKTVSSDTVSQLVIYPGDTTICVDESVSYTVNGVFDNIVWTPNLWIDDPNASTVTITPLANISYIISAVNGVCAAARDTFSIRVLQEIPIEVMATPEQVVLGLSSTITSQIGGQIDSIVWSPDETLDCRECPNPIALPTQTTTYTATIYYSENGITCIKSASVTIVVLAACDNSIIYLPNTFTPNGDELNDVFMIRGLAATRIKHFRVFDRWGKLMFEATGGEPNEPKWGWDGNSPAGEKLNSAVFVYTYEIECINGDIVTGQGNVTLLR